ncbi:MAG: lysophospholipid acyltransferase family protein [Chthonomonadales bacterium]|nr:lysophospholipid acyltransferase family protein [Chthonomonadales bacterium]
MARDSESVPSPSWRTKALALIIWAIARFIGATIRIQFVNKAVMDGILAANRGAILVTWHGRTLIPANVLRHRGYWALISLSRDGEMQNGIFTRFGFNTVRGSTSRGGLRATLRLARILRDGGVLALTPDGPRGPSHEVQGGTLLLAEKSGVPIVPVGISARPRFLVRSWDRYMLPLPFARVTWVVGDPITVPEGVKRDEMDRIGRDLTLSLNRCEKRAEEMLGYSYPRHWPLEE